MPSNQILGVNPTVFYSMIVIVTLSIIFVVLYLCFYEFIFKCRRVKTGDKANAKTTQNVDANEDSITLVILD